METHSLTKEKHLCPVCNIAFPRKTDLTNHVKQHQDSSNETNDLTDKNFVCEFCARTFVRSGDLLVHRRCHTQERPFKCHYCEKSRYDYKFCESKF